MRAQRREATADVVIVRVSYRLLSGRLRRYLLAILLLGIAVSAVTVIFSHPRHANADGSPIASLVLAVAGVLSAGYALWAARRFGYYARPGEVGIVGFGGHLTPLRTPAVGFERFTMTNAGWLRWVGLGSLLAVHTIVAVNAHGQRVLLLSSIAYSQADMDRFLSASQLPVKGRWADYVGQFSIRQRWPGSIDTRRQVWMAAWAVMPAAVVYVALFVAWRFLVR